MVTSEAKKPEVVQDPDFYIWRKGDKVKLSPHFSTTEFSCHCNYSECVEQKISKDLITRLEQVRVEVNQPLVITSAYRCSAYQAKLRADGVNTVVAKLSQHELGKAADVVPKDRKDVRGSFLIICQKRFNAIGLSDKFLHLDLRPQYIRWEY